MAEILDIRHIAESSAARTWAPKYRSARAVVAALVLCLSAATSVVQARQGGARRPGTTITYRALGDFPALNAGEVPYYRDNGRNALAINAGSKDYRDKYARAERIFDRASGEFDVTITTLTEEDGESTYRLLINGTRAGSYQNPRVKKSGDSQPSTHTWTGIQLKTGDTIAVESNTHSNGVIPEGDGHAWARGRWRQITLVGEGGGEDAGASGGAVASAPSDGAAFEHSGDGKVSGELKKWHRVTIGFEGPDTSETATPNPFTDYRLDVAFTNGASRYIVPGYYAADGNAANSGASSGNVWLVHFAPDRSGTWRWQASFKKGPGVAQNGGGRSAGFFDRRGGSFVVAETDKSGRDMRARGMLRYVGKHYLQFAETGEYFLKQGADAPENLLAYADFDGDFKSDGNKDNLIKTWGAHVRDWTTGDPTWAGGRGKGLIGAVNYLASEGMNVFSFLPMNIGGDDRNVFPYLNYKERLRMDCSRLAQWEVVFAHGSRKGMFLHFKTQETENELLLDKGDLGPQRRLYYRELIARFAHHPALNWNLGEEINNANTAQKKAWAQFFWDTDPYHHHIVIHNMGNPHYDLLGQGSKLTGFSLQTNKSNFSQVHRRVLDYLNRSAKAGKPWAVACDEPGDASHSLRPDKDAGNAHVDGRKNGLWGTFMAGGWGNEWYFGYRHAHSDLTCQDFRSRDKWWDYCRYALEFFNDNKIPVHEMVNNNTVSSAENDYCFYKRGVVYVVYLKNGGTTNLDLAGARGTFSVGWYDPRNGGELQRGSVTRVNGGGRRSLGTAPGSPEEDWVILIAGNGFSKRSR